MMSRVSRILIISFSGFDTVQISPPLIRQPKGLTPSPKIREKAYIESANIGYGDVIQIQKVLCEILYFRC